MMQGLIPGVPPSPPTSAGENDNKNEAGHPVAMPVY